MITSINLTISKYPKNLMLRLLRSILFLSQLKVNLKFLFIALISFSLISCVPSEESLTQAVIDGDTTFGGFAGITAVQTLSQSQVRVSWVRSPLDRVVSYNIYNSTLPSQPVLVKTVDADSASTTITGLNRNVLYRFRVKAVDDQGREDSNETDAPGIPFGGAQSVSVTSSTSARMVYSPTNAGEALSATTYCFTNLDPDYQAVASITDMNATFVDIQNLVTNTQYTCKIHVSVDGIEDNNTQTVSFTALGSADRLVFLTQPGNAQAGQVLAQQPVIHVLDENDNIVSGGPDASALITLEIATTSPTGGTVRGTFAVNAVAGVATFTDIFFQESGNKILSARKGDTSSFSFGTPEMAVDSNAFNITPGNISPDLTTLTIDPAIIPPFDALVANGVDAYTVTFTLRDAFGNPVPGIRPQFASNIVGDFISQPLLNSDASGVTTGSISTTIADTNPARVLSISSPSGLNSIQVAAPFKPGPPTRLAYLVQPQNAPSGPASMNEIRVAVQDAQGNLITTGATASSVINLTISNNVNGAILTGTNPVTAANGIAIFSDLGIDRTGNGYRLLAGSGSLNPVTSNSFNITAGTPAAVDISGPTEVRSGQCSGQISVQLRDGGGNLANAQGTTTVQLSGLGASLLYASATCAGAPLSSNVTFTPGTNTRTLYLRNNQSLQLNIAVTDTSNFLTPDSLTLNVTPSQIRLVAQAAPPAAPGTPLTVLSGQCSSAIVISPLDSLGNAGQVFGTTSVVMSGILGSEARLYSNSTCTTEIPASDIVLTPGVATNTLVYLRDPRGENLLVNVADPLGQIATVSTPQEIKVLASRITFNGPSSVVAGQCSAVFTVRIQDTLNNNVPAHQNLNLRINGVQGVSTSGRFYTSSACTGGGSNTTVVMPNNSSATTIYFRGNQAEVLDIFISDPDTGMTQSATRRLTVSPSAFRITAPAAPASSLTSQCRGPFLLETLDGAGTVAPVVETTQANLTGGGSSGAFYNDAECEIVITSTTFVTGQSVREFYFKGQFPAPSLTLTATHSTGVLTAATQSWSVLGAKSWLGTASTQTDVNGDLLPFRTGFKPVSARFDGVRGGTHMAFSTDRQFLFIADTQGHRVIKYDYQNLEYRGWIGRLRLEDGIGSSGSNQANPSPALCIGTTNDSPLPGWCLGGQSINGNETRGGFNSPFGIHADDTYVYISSTSTNSISRHRIDSGEFEGWIGRVNNTSPTGPATGGPAGCSSVPNSTTTPGWCLGGNISNDGTRIGDGRMPNPYGITSDSVYLYVGVSGAVLRFNKTTGQFQGWIGMVDQTPTGGAVGCTVAASDTVTPGWCFGGRFKFVNASNHLGLPGGMNNARDVVVDGTNLYVLNSDSGGVINRYNVNTGAFIQRLPNLNFNWTNPMQMDFDGTHFYVAADERILKVGTSGLIESWMGKVANSGAMSGNPGCNTLSTNDNTPGWCIGGTHKPGLDETSFIDTWGIALDGAGSFVTTSRNIPTIKKFNVVTGNYQGSIGLESISPRSWSDNATQANEFEGFDDFATFNPMGTLIVGDFLFVTELDNSRVKKINRRTGELIGWLGAITSRATGGQDLPGCTSANAMGPSPSWCLGASNYPSWTWGDQNLIASTVDGIMLRPSGLASDGTWLYITDNTLNRIQRFRVDNGSYGGWIGRVGNGGTNLPTGGDPGCTSVGANNFTPGWCLGGLSREGSGDGHMHDPTGITYHAGNLYVMDARNNRISSYNATTGSFNGWIGRIGSTAGLSGCTFASNSQYNVSTSGWCRGGSPQRGNDNSDRGGGFSFEYGGYNRGDIHTDGSHLFITNIRNNRIDQYTFDGELVRAVSTRQDVYINTWQTINTSIGSIGVNCSRVIGVWVDTNLIYGLNADSCGGNGASLWRMDKTTGNIIGWSGGIQSGFPVTGGDPGCAGSTGVTPGWCQGGRVSRGSTLGYFTDNRGSITGDDQFIYVTDTAGNRITRVPK